MRMLVLLLPCSCFGAALGGHKLTRPDLRQPGDQRQRHGIGTVHRDRPHIYAGPGEYAKHVAHGAGDRQTI
jgi:hypothetical protein